LKYIHKIKNMNSAKLYQLEDGFLLEKNEGNFEIKNSGVYPTTRTGNDLTEAPFDITAMGVLENAIVAMSAFAPVGLAIGLKIVFIEKSEDFD